MAIELIDKIKQKNGGLFKLIDAIDVEMQNGDDLEICINKISDNIEHVSDDLDTIGDIVEDHILNHPSAGEECGIYVGEDLPEDSYEVWIDTSDSNGLTVNIEDSVLDEFRSMFSFLQSEVKKLKDKNIELEARIEYLEIYGGGGGTSPEPDDTDAIVLIFEDGTKMEFEDGSLMTFEGVNQTTNNTKMIFEDNSKMTFENNDILIFEGVS